MTTRLTMLAGGACAALVLSACGDSGPGSGTTPDPVDVLDDATNDVAAPDTGDDTTPTPDTGPDGGPDVTPDTEDGTDDTGDAAPDAEPSLCREDQCDIDGACYDNGDVNPDNPCEACFVLVARDAFSPDDEGICDDGDDCTVDDVCRDGLCIGGPSPCDDGNPCTTSVCDEETGACVNVNVEGPCSDGDPCTVGDMCMDGLCMPGADPLSCDDGNVCTSNRCEPGVGCVAEPNDGAPCDDGNLCTSGDVCQDGLCLPGDEPFDCDDNNLCTIDRCDPVAGCVYRDISDLCGDDNPCTDAMCDPARGCVYPFNTNPCDDNNLCTEGDICTDGVCRGAPVDFDDGNVCTDNACDPVTGIITQPNTEACDDGNACTVGDLCVDGGCEPGTTPLVCNDNNVCTDDDCDPETGCVFTPNTSPCDDNNLCTVNNVCADGTCTGEPVDCDDGNACTVNTCSPTLGCQTELVVTDACRPNIVVTFPPRGAFVPADASGSITVTGRVFSGAGDITSFRINGQAVTPAPGDGSFTFPLSPDFGGNILTFEAEDSFGTMRERVQSFLYSDTWTDLNADDPEEAFVPNGLGIVLGQGALDELQVVLDTFVNDLDLAELLGASGDALLPGQSRTFLAEDTDLRNNRTVSGRAGERLTFLLATNASNADIIIFLREQGTFADGEFTLTTPAVTFGDPEITLAFEDDAIFFRVRIPNIRINLRIERWNTGNLLNAALVAAIPTTTTATATALTATTRIRATVVDGEPVFEADPVTAVLSGFSTTNAVLNIALAFIDLGLDTAIAEALDDVLGGLVDDLFGGILGALALNLPLEIPALAEGGEPTTVALVTDFQDLAIRGPGTNAFGTAVPGSLEVTLKAGTEADAVTSYLPTSLGVPGRSQCTFGGDQRLTMLREGDVEVGLADDAINAILYGVWSAGVLEQPLPDSLFEGVDLGSFGVTRLELALSGMLPPVASDCGTTDGSIRVHVGDLRIDATVELLGIEVELVVFASAEATISIGADPDGIGIFLEGIDRIELEVNAVDEAQRGFEDIIKDLLEDQLADIIGSLIGGDGDESGALFAFELPEIDLGGLSEDFEGTVLRIETLGADRFDGTSLITGALSGLSAP